MPPAHPIAAVTHPNPYPYYERLVAERPLYYDTELACWVVSSAAVVTAILTDPNCRVRPVAEPVPPSLSGSPAGELFRRLVRMTDGREHERLRPAIATALDTVTKPDSETTIQRWATTLLAGRDDDPSPGKFANYAMGLPVYVVGSLLGIADAHLGQIVPWVDDFTRCLTPKSTPEQVERGKDAAVQLTSLIRATCHDRESELPNGPLHSLAHALTSIEDNTEEAVIANGVGLLAQTYEATGGLIGNTLLALASRPELLQQVASDLERTRQLVHEVLRFDSPIQNTRRFVATDGAIAGQPVTAGEMVLIVLAAANRDPLANPNPERFAVQRSHRRLFTFGAGPHACPGAALASTIATIGVNQIIASGLDIGPLAGAVVYRPSANARVPILGFTK
ncbi:MAG: cytochrome P450 [Chloroflexia bacterium]|nr:cytochrome P450 [Chloroflexia bacterium]